MKMYEYLACQKPIVSTAGGGIEQFKEQVYITNDFQEFNDYIQKALSKNPSSAKATEGRNKLEVVKEHSWFKRVEQMLELIEKKLWKKYTYQWSLSVGKLKKFLKIV